MKKLKVIFLILMISFISIVLNPSIYGYGVNDLDNLNNQSDKATSVLSQSINNGSILDMLQSSSDDVSTISNEDYGIMPIATRTVWNESELRSALNDRVYDIVVGNGFACSSPITINYKVQIRPANNNNSISYNGGGTNLSFITITNGGHLELRSIVSFTDGNTKNINLTNINIQSGGKLTLYENSIIDTGLGNTGIIVNSGAECIIHSCHVVEAKVGILVKGTGKLTFEQTESGRKSEFWQNTTCILFENGCTGTYNFNKDNILMRNNYSGTCIDVQSPNATVNISAGEWRDNTSSDIIFARTGKVNISGGTIRNNGSANGIRQEEATLNITGGSIYSNKVGIYTDPAYTGKMTITNTNIYSNSQYAINHSQDADNTCVIHGGTITGNVYLGKNNNYVNTDTSYPRFTVLPSTYYFKRRLVRTSSNSNANTEINNVTLVPNGEWYTFVDTNEDEYISICKDCIVRVHYKDNKGNELDTKTIKGREGDLYYADELEIEGFNMVERPNNAMGTMSDTEIDVTYIYELKKSTIDIQKILGETFNTEKRNLEGVRFKAKALSFPDKVTLTNPEEEYLSNVTDENGKCVIENLPYGEYEITEVEKPSDVYDSGMYVNDSEELVKSFKIKVNEERVYSYNIENVPKKLQIKICKEDAETGAIPQGDATLDGAIFGIYKDYNCTELLEEVTIQKYKLENDNIEYMAESELYLSGKYYIREITPSNGYIRDEKVYIVESNPLNQEEETITCNVLSKSYKISSFTIVYFQENPNDDKYTNIGTYKINGIKSGTKISDINGIEDTISKHFDEIKGEEKEYFNYFSEKSYADMEQVVKGDDSSIVKVYYNRNKYTISFNATKEYVDEESNNMRQINIYDNSKYKWITTEENAKIHIDNNIYENEYVLEAKYGEDISDKWPTYDKIEDISAGNITYKFAGWKTDERSKYNKENMIVKYNMMSSELIVNPSNPNEVHEIYGNWIEVPTWYEFHYLYEDIDENESINSKLYNGKYYTEMETEKVRNNRITVYLNDVERSGFEVEKLETNITNTTQGTSEDNPIPVYIYYKRNEYYLVINNDDEVYTPSKIDEELKNKGIYLSKDEYGYQRVVIKYGIEMSIVQELINQWQNDEDNKLEYQEQLDKPYFAMIENWYCSPDMEEKFEWNNINYLNYDKVINIYPNWIIKSE